MSSDITLTSVQQDTLLQLQNASSLFNRTQDRLNTGKKVNSVTDDAVAYFRSTSLYDRTGALETRKGNIDQSVSAVSAALDATSAVDGLLKQLKGVLEGARGAVLSQRVAATTQFKNIAKQLAQLVKDATYQGLNILTSTTASLSTQFSERTAATLTINGFNLCGTGIGNTNSLFTGATGAFKADGSLNFSNVVLGGPANLGVLGFSALNLTSQLGTITVSLAEQIFGQSDNRIDAAIAQNEAISASLGINVSILQARSTFTADYSVTLSEGGDKLTLADLNTEAANSQALTLRQQIGIQSLSVSGQQNQSILNLLK
ncbi:MAG TPA: flagellin [Aliidongia sp.]|uniref:flagellin N-terminal helical domain-containing protein n=1 Tax=Aliidongia sp. TaxID=1914230 RepID=UPI002DDCCAAC|nr:flagellin [Aliidongia sp.]HEV2674336.1 flagellin [Aliidongia sp.]